MFAIFAKFETLPLFVVCTVRYFERMMFDFGTDVRCAYGPYGMDHGSGWTPTSITKLKIVKFLIESSGALRAPSGSLPQHFSDCFLKTWFLREISLRAGFH